MTRPRWPKSPKPQTSSPPEVQRPYGSAGTEHPGWTHRACPGLCSFPGAPAPGARISPADGSGEDFAIGCGPSSKPSSPVGSIKLEHTPGPAILTGRHFHGLVFLHRGLGQFCRSKKKTLRKGSWAVFKSSCTFFFPRESHSYRVVPASPAFEGQNWGSPGRSVSFRAAIGFPGFGHPGPPLVWPVPDQWRYPDR